MCDNRYYISFRGNIFGRDPNKENTVSYVKDALQQGFDVIVDIWVIHGRIMMGTTEELAQKVSIDFLSNNKIWCNARNVDAEILLGSCGEKIHYFTFFETELDTMTQTSKRFTLAHFANVINATPAAANAFDRVIVMFPENGVPNDRDLRQGKGICSNFIGHYKRRLEAKNKRAMLLSGRVKCYELALKEQLDTFYRENSDSYIYIFVSLNSQNDAYTQQFYNDVFPCAMHVAPYVCDLKYINHPNIRYEYLYKRHLLGNSMSHYYNNKKAFEFLDTMFHDIDFQYVMLYRSDIVSPSLPNILFDVKPHNIYYPNCRIFHPDWISNEIVIGDKETMKCYTSLYQYIDTYIYKENVLLHPETLITYHMMKQGIGCNPFVFPYDLHSARRET